ncbi:MAG: DNA polymerase IV [Candidatus Alcyoniella australis]|nr:DNA polymerase IV [Candidatus Alcyoniella australis]
MGNRIVSGAATAQKLCNRQRAIMHVDMDAFFASIEQRDDPTLRGRPVAVGGPAQGRGVVAAASYEARQFGVHSAMSMARALLLCPNLVRVDPRFDAYNTASNLLFEILRSYSPLVEPLSCDEAFVDLEGTARLWGPPRGVAQQVKLRVAHELELTASVGLADSRLVAKVASDLQKPDGLVVVPPGESRAFLAPLAVGRLWGVGPRAQQQLARHNIETIGQLAQTSEQWLLSTFGVHGPRLKQMAGGIDSTPVHTEHERRSISHEQTFASDLAQRAQLEACLDRLVARVGNRLRSQRLYAKSVGLKLRYADFSTITRGLTLPCATQVTATLLHAAHEMFDQAWRDHRPLRLIGFAVRGLVDRPVGQGELLGDPARTSVGCSCWARPATRSGSALAKARFYRPAPRP